MSAPFTTPDSVESADVRYSGASHQPVQSRSVDQIGISGVVPIYPDAVGVDADAVAEARRIHLRQNLHQALDHGFALLDALDLGPAALDEIDHAIRTLDALDAPDEDREPWLAGYHYCETPLDAEQEPEHDENDGTSEPSLASPERHPSPPVVTWGGPFTARGGDESQLRWAEGARQDGELVDEDGPIDEDELDGAGDVDPEPSIGWPEDFTAEVAPTLEAGADAEHDDADLEGDPAGDLTWVFGPSRREVAHA